MDKREHYTFLKDVKYLILNDYVIKLLAKKSIFTVIDFMNVDTNILANIANLTFSEVSATKKYINKKYGAKPINGIQVYNKLLEKMLIIETGIASFDLIIEGGLITGHLFEFCGLPASGKTWMCNTIAVNLSQKYNLETFYIDSKADFSGTRIYQMLESKTLDYDNIAATMKRIKCERVYNVHEFLTLLKEIERQIGNYAKVKLIIVDSMPSMWFQLHGDYFRQGIRYLTEAANLMRKLAVEHQLIIILVNLVTKWQNIDSNESSENVELFKDVPALGKYWQSVPSTRFLMTETEEESYYTVKVLKSNQYKTGLQCKVQITNQGIV